MFLNDLRIVYQNNKDKSPVFLRTLFKETVQYYLLDFISKSIWLENLIFKGGTCLRICFNLPRLSEDLDFDIADPKSFDIRIFIAQLSSYFIKTLQFSKLTIKLADNKRTIYIKFPILTDIGVPLRKNESNVLFVRVDLSYSVGKNYKTEISIKSTYNFSFLIKRYSLPDLFAGKISAILTREALQGKVKKERLKGRDYYDLIWFLEKGARPNWLYLKEITNLTKTQAIKKLEQKINRISPQFIENDLIPFFEDIVFIKNFAKNFKNLFQNYKNSLE